MVLEAAHSPRVKWFAINRSRVVRLGDRCGPLNEARLDRRVALPPPGHVVPSSAIGWDVGNDSIEEASIAASVRCDARLLAILNDNRIFAEQFQGGANDAITHAGVAVLVGFL